ncbi:MFS transporter [Xanthomonas translucens pv. translucens]|uniref:MFS transporter n=2 Tax=Xanthomonas campestris pv. translucens TaxID=343 RepID=UPI0019D6D8B9|nr:MFS transporter [Xanthomonas translucens pv. translucens]QSQ45419.1 MFS transporter [Xanthomonas translucens pv. translucens]
MNHLAQARMAFPVVLLGSLVLLGGLDQSMLVVAIPAIGREFTSSVEPGLVVSSYAVAAAISVPCFGALANRLGAWPSLGFALTVFLAGSAACALSQFFPALVAARALQGAGAGGMGTGAQLVAVERMSVADRAWLQSSMSLVILLSGALGPILGVGILKHASWRAFFWLNVPILLSQLILLICYFGLPTRSRHAAVSASFDYVGMLIFASFSLSLLAASSRIGGHTSFSGFAGFPVKPPIYSLISLASLVALLTRGMQSTTAFIPVRAVGLQVWGLAAYSFLHVGLITALPLAMTMAFTDTGQHGSLAPALFAFTAAVPAGALVSGIRIRAGSQPIVLITSGALLQAIGLEVAIYLLDGRTMIWTWGIAIAGFAAGISMPATMISAQQCAPYPQEKSATYLIACCRSMGAGCAAVIFSWAPTADHVRPEQAGLGLDLAPLHAALGPAFARAEFAAQTAALWAILLFAIQVQWGTRTGADD